MRTNDCTHREFLKLAGAGTAALAASRVTGEHPEIVRSLTERTQAFDKKLKANRRASGRSGRRRE
jgi:hypothetical protein